MARNAKSKIYPHLWYAKEAEEAARFYVHLPGFAHRPGHAALE